MQEYSTVRQWQISQFEPNSSFYLSQLLYRSQFFVRLFVRSFVCLSVHSPVYSFVRSLFRSLVSSFVSSMFTAASCRLLMRPLFMQFGRMTGLISEAHALSVCALNFKYLFNLKNPIALSALSKQQIPTISQQTYQLIDFTIYMYLLSMNNYQLKAELCQFCHCWVD